jgi:chromosome segregation ATPase
VRGGDQTGGESLRSDHRQKLGTSRLAVRRVKADAHRALSVTPNVTAGISLVTTDSTLTTIPSKSQNIQVVHCQHLPMDQEIVSATEREAELARQLDQERKKATQISRALFELEVQLAASQSQLEDSQAAHDRLQAELARVTYERAQAVASRIHVEGLLKLKDTSKDGKIRQLEDALSYAAKLNGYGKDSKTDTR